MMRARHLQFPTALGLVLAAAGCSTSPDPVLYTIAPVSGPEHAGAPNIILLQQIGLERYLDRPQIVRSSENYRLEVMTNDQWGEPLAAMLSRILVAELGQRLPRSAVIKETGAISAPPDATIAVNMQRLDEDATGVLVLQAQASVIFKGRANPVVRGFHFTVPPAGAGTSGEVAAISSALGQLADGIAAMVASAPSRT
jgi:uncharacterized lipoprotein YmbA